MKPTSCPYLSIKEDPETQLAFPSVRNCCRRARPVEPVSLDHQATHCLSTNFIHCPVPGRKLNTPLPQELRADVPTNKGHLIGAILSFTVILGIIIVGLWQSGFLVRSAAQSPVETILVDITPSPLRTEKSVFQNSTTPTLTPTVRPTLVPTEMPSPTLTITPSETATRRPTRTNEPTRTVTETGCVPPAGWVEYVVQTDDSLTKISLAFRVTVLELQKANCLGSSETIYVGQILFVPNVPTVTPRRYVTRTPTRTATLTKRNDPRTKTPIPPTKTQAPPDTPRPTNTTKPTSPPQPTRTLTPPPMPTKTFTPPPTEPGGG